MQYWFVTNWAVISSLQEKTHAKKISYLIPNIISQAFTIQVFISYIHKNNYPAYRSLVTVLQGKKNLSCHNRLPFSDSKSVVDWTEHMTLQENASTLLKAVSVSRTDYYYLALSFLWCCLDKPSEEPSRAPLFLEYFLTSLISLNFCKIIRWNLIKVLIFYKYRIWMITKEIKDSDLGKWNKTHWGDALMNDFQDKPNRRYPDHLQQMRWWLRKVWKTVTAPTWAGIFSVENCRKQVFSMWKTVDSTNMQHEQVF